MAFNQVPEVAKAAASIKPKELRELKAWNSPPRAVVTLMEAVIITLDKPM